MCNPREVAAYLAVVSKKIGGAFFDIKDDSTASAAYKVAKTTLQRVVYAVADYWLMAASAVFIVVMDKQFEYGALGLFFLMWAFDLIVANAFVVIWKRTGEDVTLGESYRRAADAIHQESRVAGVMAFGAVVAKATFWDGPEHIVIFFEKELKTELRMLLVILALTAVQAAIWTPIYILGFDTVTELYGYVVELLFI